MPQAATLPSSPSAPFAQKKQLSSRVLHRISELFPPAHLDTVYAVLSRCATSAKADRICLDILELSRGDLNLLERAAELALVDFRDLILLAEYEFRDCRYVPKSTLSC